MQLSYLFALAGGVLIGLGASLLLVFNGQIAGISGILGDLVRRGWHIESVWRWSFVLGLLAGGVCVQLFYPQAIPEAFPRSLPALAVAGLLVGFGTQLGSGCTSGHGVCGMSRLSRRSIIATLIFMTTGAMSVLAVRVLAGGSI